jgi:predicted peroxiredoxin
MREAVSPAAKKEDHGGAADLYIVLCASGFDNVERTRSALMFASLAASAGFRTILYCIQGAVEVMVTGAIEKNEAPVPGVPTRAGRLREAMEMGVEVQCCTQTMANKGIEAGDLISDVRPAGAMTLIDLAAEARGTLCF